MKTRATKREGEKKTEKSKVFFTLQVITDLEELLSPQTDRMETRNTSRTLKCSPEDGEENHLFLLMSLTEELPTYSNTGRVIG